MTPCDRVVTPEEFSLHRPLFDALADNIISGLSDKTIDEISLSIGISHSLARKMKTMIYEFPNKSTGAEAIRAYTGVVFNALQYETLSDCARRKCLDDVRIISSLYGLLNPDDIIKSYRTDFTSPIAPLSQPLWKYYRMHNTIALGKYLQDTGTKEILDLLPGDAAKSIDWKTIKRFARVYKADFIEVTETGEKTPNAGRLKKLRGELLRDILMNDINKVADLASLEGESYMFDGTADFSGHLRFTTA